MGKISVAEFEAKVQEKEEVVIKVRAPRGSMVEDYEYTRKSAGTQSMTEWMENRIKPCLGSFEVEIIDGEYAKPHGRTRMETLRASYDR